MSNVFVDKTKIDNLANAISVKSGESVPMTLTEMTQAVDGIDTSGGGITPTGNIDITQAGVTDVTNYATATVPETTAYITAGDAEFYTSGANRRWRIYGKAVIDSGDSYDAGWLGETKVGSYAYNTYAVASGTTVTPTTSAQTIGGANYMMEGAVTVSAMPTGTAGTPTATKGAVNNHAISVTPSVTNTAGYISGGTKTGTAVSVSASELVSGTLSVTQNGTADVTNYASVDVSVSGGGGGSVQIGIGDNELASASSSITFNGLNGEPTSFTLWETNELATGASPYKVAMVVYDGTNVIGQTITNTNNAQVTYDSSSFSYTYNNGTLTVSSTGAHFQPIIYYLAYSYDGSAGNVKTADVQVGSGATSITFTDLEDEPIAWSCIFKSNFGSSNGYQRVIGVVYDAEDDIVGLEMDTSAKYMAHWSYSYNNGSLTITSQSTNEGGYFHQPGYYQLTYVIADASPYEKKSETYRASTSAQTDKIEPSSGYDAMSEVNITIPAVTQTNLTADNIKSGTTVSISNGQSNLWAVTGTYGGGGTSKNAQTIQSTQRTSASSYTKLTGDLTVAKAGTYDVYWDGFRSSTSGTWGSQLYINGSAYGTSQATFSNHVQNVHLQSVALSASDKLSVYARSRGNSYYAYIGELTIIEA